MEKTVPAVAQPRSETAISQQLARREAAVSAGQASALDLRLRAVMLQRAAERQRASLPSILIGVFLVALVHWDGPAAGLLPYFVALRLGLVLHSHWIVRRITSLHGKPEQVLAFEDRFVFSLGAAGAAWALIGWMVPDIDMQHWSARDVFSGLILVHISSVMLITAAHSPRGLIAHVCALWLMAIAPTLVHLDKVDESMVIVTAVLCMLATSMSYGRVIVRQTREGVLAELQREDLTESLRVANLDLEQALHLAVDAASHDPLTGALNRRALYARAEQIAADRRRNNRPCALLVLDLDHFKRINDRHGHAVGDAVLTSLSAMLSRELREVDVIARWGGEEFLVVMPDCTIESALARAEQVRTEVATMVVGALPSGYPIRVSIGAAEWPMDEALDDAINRADAALYEAKGAGRDRVVLAD